MKKSPTCLLKAILASAFCFLLPAPAAFAQVLAPHVQRFDPSVTDPGYDARKATGTPPVPVVAPVRHARLTNVVISLPACYEEVDTVSSGGYTALPRGDDNSIGPISLGFNFALFGTVYNSCYINNNGNLTFTAPMVAYTSQGFPNSTPMVTAFWGDVDTRAATSGRVWYKVFPDRLVVFWNNVASFPFNQNATLKNTFELIIRRNTAAPTPSPDVTFAYGDMQWTTGTASGGSQGFDGTPATVGVNQGNGTGNFIQTGRFNANSAAIPQPTYPDGVYSGVNWLDGRCVEYTIAPAGNLPPTATGFPTNNTITLNQGQTATITPQFAAPESGQTTAVVYNTNALCNATVVMNSSTSPTPTVTVTGSPCNIGTHVISFQATDNGTPVASTSFDLTVIVNPTTQWTGAVSTAYELPGNWNLNAVPTGSDDVLIPASAVRMPLLTTAQSVASLTIATGDTMTVDTGGELTLTGALTANGLCQGLGAVRATGASPQTFGGSSGLHIGDLTVGPAGVGLAGPLRVQHTLVLKGNLTTNAQPCTLLSDAQGTALVVNNVSAQVTGNVLVQRYLDPSQNPGLGYRHFSSPVQSTTFDDLTVTRQFTPVANSAYNTVGNTATPFPTVFGYDESRVGPAGGLDFDRGWASPAATTGTMTPGTGYTVNVAAGLTVDFLGALNNGAVPRTGLTRGTGANAGWQLLGNPYPAPLDWNLVYPQASGLDDAVYVFKSTGTYTGSYAAYVNRIGTSSARYLGVGQAFFVRTSTAGTPGALSFSNDMRLTSYQNVAMQRSSQTTADQRPQLRLELVGSNAQTEETYVYFENGATAAFDRAYDAYKVPGGDLLYLATGTGSPAFSINGLPALTPAGAAVPLLTYVPQAGTYSLRVGSLLNFNPATSVWLEDRQSGLWHDLRLQTSFAFQASRPDDAATRFVLHFGQARLLGTAAQLPAEAVQVYPNPASGLLNVQLTALPKDALTAQLALSNTLGQTVRQQEIALHNGAATATFNLVDLAPGVYILRGATATHVFTRSVVVK
ncbi:nidogen-like domain-containing protein [Hymenobacter terricola]|uniref:nidogen-like domain-containing protein n=1 Tax=Hymenobacter terricola TaxID=2819236 RepID=UPI001B30DB47|nr:nidogen-like domain-containing protein [Hymenobacter terricola]